MTDTPITCVVARHQAARPLRAVRRSGLPALREALTSAQRAYLEAVGFEAAAHELLMLPGPDGLPEALLGLGSDRTPHAFGALARKLPAGSAWILEPGDYEMDAAVLGFCFGAYHYSKYKPAKRSPALLVVPDLDSRRAALSQAEAVWMVRDLVNAPANLLGPAELADATEALGRRFGAQTRRTEGAALVREYPAIAAVGAGSARPPVVAAFDWAGSAAQADAPRISLCGKGVCFDTGGYDLKPSSAMLRMKKDMGGAACLLGLARMVMDADLPLRLSVRIGCVENSVSGSAMRPSDVIATRRGLSVEVGNTDAEGRLVLCDLLAEASDADPDLLIDAATLTGAARVALGPDLPALFCADDGFAAALAAAGQAVADPVWRLPLWAGYDQWLNSEVGDLNNVSSKPQAGAITAALFLQRFLKPGVLWAHLDLYAWNDRSSPGRPEGGEAQAIRALLHALRSSETAALLAERRGNAARPDQNSQVT
jgi:leucyl aminopeptidase